MRRGSQRSASLPLAFKGVLSSKDRGVLVTFTLQLLWRSNSLRGSTDLPLVLDCLLLLTPAPGLLYSKAARKAEGRSEKRGGHLCLNLSAHGNVENSISFASVKISNYTNDGYQTATCGGFMLTIPIRISWISVRATIMVLVLNMVQENTSALSFPFPHGTTICHHPVYRLIRSA